MKNKKIVGLVIAFIVVAGISFYAGSKFGGNSNPAPMAQNGNGFARAGGATNGAGTQRGARAGGGFVSGQIVSKDATSITVQLNAVGSQNGTANTQTQEGSKIVFYTNGTAIMETTDGTVDDLAVGKNISVTGTANPDGSVNAQSIQIRPAAPAKPVSAQQ